jgi:hypothetical protein
MLTVSTQEKKTKHSKAQWFISIIPDMQESENGRFEVQVQLRKKVSQTPS